MLPKKTVQYLDNILLKDGISVERTSYDPDVFNNADPHYVVKGGQDGHEYARLKVFSLGHLFVSYSIIVPGHSGARVLVRPAREKHSSNARYVLGVQNMLEQKFGGWQQ